MKTEEQYIAESKADKQAFEAWWYNEGSGIVPRPSEEIEMFAMRITEIAWMNGSFKAREESTPRATLTINLGEVGAK